MKSQYLVPVLLSLAAVTQTLQIIPTGPQSNFPECGLNCAVFQQTQAVCGQQEPNLTAENCFCQAAAVQAFYASADNVCAAECASPSDRTALRNWFTGFCGQVGSGTDPLATTATQSGAAAPTKTVTFQPGSVDKQHETGSAWFKDHWQWILMVVILLIAFVGITFLFRWLRDRYERGLAEKSKPSPQRASRRISDILMSPTEKPKPRPTSDASDLWGPHQHMAASQGYQYDMEHGNYPAGGARADPWRTEGRDSSKFNSAGNVQVTEVGNTRGNAEWHSAELGRAHPGGKISYR